MWCVSLFMMRAPQSLGELRRTILHVKKLHKTMSILEPNFTFSYTLHNILVNRDTRFFNSLPAHRLDKYVERWFYSQKYRQRLQTRNLTSQFPPTVDCDILVGRPPPFFKIPTACSLDVYRVVITHIKSLQKEPQAQTRSVLKPNLTFLSTLHHDYPRPR
jgi:hypothetical protein